MFAFVEANAFGQLVSSVAGRPFSTHMPFLVIADRKNSLGISPDKTPSGPKLMVRKY